MVLIYKQIQGGYVPGDDEEFLSVIKPTELGRSCCVNGDCLCAHFAFYTQRDYLDKQDILGKYGVYMRKQWRNDERMMPILEKMDDIVRWISENQTTINQRPDIYISGQVPQSKVKALRKAIGRVRLPFITLKSVKQICGMFRKTKSCINLIQSIE